MAAAAEGERPTQAERRAAAEAALLQAAAELIAERGIERTSMRSVGARAGVSRAMPGCHFGSKDALITRIAERGHDRTLAAAVAAAFDKAERDFEDLSTLAALRLVIEAFISVFTSAAAPEERPKSARWS